MIIDLYHCIGHPSLEGQNVLNFPHLSHIRWSRHPDFATFYLYIRIHI